MLRTSGLPSLFLLLSVACGTEESIVQNEKSTLVASESTSTLTPTCEPFPTVKLETISYCKTLPNGSVSKVDLKPSTFVQDPATCEISSADDGMRATMMEMGYEVCESSFLPSRSL